MSLRTMSGLALLLWLAAILFGEVAFHWLFALALVAWVVGALLGDRPTW